MTSTPGSYYLYPGTPSPDWWNASSNPQSIGAGTSEQGYGWGVPGFGQAPVQINPANLAGLSDPNLAPGYIPGSSRYNQYDLSQGTLFGNIGGVLSNLNYGVGGPGDPTNGTEPQTPDEWIQGGKLFTWSGNMGKIPGTEGLDYIATLFGRSDTPSGIGTPAWNAPKQYWDGLAQAIAKGVVTPTNRGWAALQAKGYTPQQVGGAAVQQAASVGVQPTGAGASGSSTGAGGAQGGTATQNALASIAASQAADQAARLAYTSWQMRTGDEQLAMQKAQQAWTQTFQEKQAEASALGTYGGQQTQQAQQQAFAQEMSRAQFQFQQDQAELAQRLAEAGLTGTYQGQATMAKLQQDFQQRMTELQSRMTEAGLTGTYNGQQTQQAQQQAWSQGFQQQQADRSTGMGLLQLQSSLSGPRDWAKYWQLSASAPQGMTSALQSLAGQYNFAPGAQGTPGAATLQSRTADLLSGGQLGQGGQQQPAQPTAGGDPAQSGTVPNPWQFNLQNYARMAPSLQQGVLGGLEASGLYGPDVEAQLRAAAPRYTGPSTAQVGF
jgi:hypothetical protein